ncbi:plasmid replication/partition related protein [Corticibacter populi]|uniref:Plasmid replication/partition related protein n=1 Tax=Corticibacter populi TaxID=1550736 RepID=A0A3M6QY57_9BURK|nr:plasmid replication/partition related protein [Corticibacter populi]RMX07924.1 plasmid replication/partition related protein [Corticibacter populi]RZS35163.1 hypothetical protein EV687_0220 [Corticibacter populi]
MDIVVKEELKAYIDPLSEDEYAALERSILAEGCRDALVLWGNVLVDGHNRYSICEKHGLPFQTVQNTRFQSMEDVYLWMIDQHLGRRSVSDFQRGVLALRKREILQERRHQYHQRGQGQPADAHSPDASDAAGTPPQADAAVPPWESDGAPTQPGPVPATAVALAVEQQDAETLGSREALARAARLSSSQVQMIEKIQRQAAPELVAAVKAGEISLSAAATVATLPEEEQKAAAIAGREELKQAAKRVREAKRKPRVESHADTEGATDAAHVELQLLRQRVAELSEENADLKRQLLVLRGQMPLAEG